jgi:DNA polymerase III subunit delta'
MPFRDILGHRSTLALVARAIDRGTLPPCLIFSGPVGVGKRSVAIAVAQAINCLNVQRQSTASDGAASTFAIDACGACPSCRRIARGIHPDVQTIAPGDTGAIKIDEIRDVLRQVGFRPFEGRRRVVIVDDAEALGREAQNALLKTLEEPPPGSMIVLVTAQPGLLLATVRSRCPTVRFGALDVADLSRWLMTHEGLGEPQARSVAAMSGGSLAAARHSAGAASGAEAYRTAAQRVLERVAGATDARDRLDSTREITGKGRGTGASERDALGHHLHAMAALLRDVSLVAANADRAAVANVDLMPALEALAPAFDRDRSINAFAAIDRALEALDYNASPKTVADWIVLQI